jgi:hypothetical protein
MTIIEQIYEIVKSLPQEQANEILNFAESIQKQHLNANQSNATLNTSTSWEELVYCLSEPGDKTFQLWKKFVPIWGKTYCGRASKCTFWIQIH